MSTDNRDSKPLVNPLPSHNDNSPEDLIRLDPDGQFDYNIRDQFEDLHKSHSGVFSKGGMYNGASGPFQAVVNMGPTQPPQRKGHLPLYPRDKLVEMQEK